MHRSGTLRGTLLAAVATALLALTGCSAPDRTAPTTPTCEKGAIKVRPGTPTDLPSGGRVGIGQVNQDATPIDTRLIFLDGGSGEADHATLAAGGTFTVRGADYSVTCVSEGLVTLDPATK